MSTVAPDFDSAVAVTANDSTDDAHGPFAGFYTGSGGAIKVHTFRGDDVTFSSAAAGTVIKMAIKRVWSTGTVAAGVLGLFGPPSPETLRQLTTGGTVAGRTDPVGT
jgi:hypothetical protein